MDDLGLTLKRAREAHGVSLKDIALRTKISVTALEALERNDLTKLPGGIFGRAFVRAYAVEIGLEPDAIVEEFMSQLQRSEREAAERNAVRVEVTADDREFLERQRQAIRWLRLAAIVVGILAVTLIAWRLHVYLAKRSAAAEAKAEEAARPAPPAREVPSPAAETAQTPAVAAPPAAAAAGLVVDIKVTADCWVSVTADGVRVVSELLRAGQGRSVQAKQEIVLDVGNAGAITWTINGQPARTLGRTGARGHARVTPETAGTFAG